MPITPIGMPRFGIAPGTLMRRDRRLGRPPRRRGGVSRFIDGLSGRSPAWRGIDQARLARDRDGIDRRRPDQSCAELGQIMSTDPTQIPILGGGFAGVYTA